MASKPSAWGSNRSNAGSAHVKLATLLRKEGYNISSEIWPETPLKKTENQLIIKQIQLETSQRVTYTSSIPYPLGNARAYMLLVCLPGIHTQSK